VKLLIIYANDGPLNSCKGMLTCFFRFVTIFFHKIVIFFSNTISRRRFWVLPDRLWSRRWRPLDPFPVRIMITSCNLVVYGSYGCPELVSRGRYSNENRQAAKPAGSW